jgi:hypothetical protein
MEILSGLEIVHGLRALGMGISISGHTSLIDTRNGRTGISIPVYNDNNLVDISNTLKLALDVILRYSSSYPFTSYPVIKANPVKPPNESILNPSP